MDTRERFRELMREMDEAQLGELALELAGAMEGRRKRISADDITVERLRDPAFAAEVRAEIDSVLKGMR